MSTIPQDVAHFRDLQLNPLLLSALEDAGYETPSPIQAQTIPLLMEGKDVLGQAQTGTGKTAAFALPLLHRIKPKQHKPQVLVLAPTRELAIQVAEAFQKYAAHMPDIHVLPIYGGADYRGQIKALKRGVHIVVGTPGRVMDHMRRGTLQLDQLQALVLDEADEMLRMGFIDDVEWVLEQTPEEKQIALFSATMPPAIRRIATEYLYEPAQITVKSVTTTADTIRQRFWMVSQVHKMDVLTRILEAEDFDAGIVFVRTKSATEEIAGKLAARGYAAAALNGDIPQNLREKIVDKLKKGELDILVATDVVARGLDVQRISLVVNYDVPYDTESYVHRIGRTGRAGRKGDAILLITPREQRMLGAIERATKQKIDKLELPTHEAINDQRIARFKQRISDTLAEEGLELFSEIVEQFQTEHNVPAEEIAAALAKMAQGNEPLLLEDRPLPGSVHPARDRKPNKKGERGERKAQDRHGDDRPPRKPRREHPRDNDGSMEEGMERFRLEVGREHGVKPGNIVGAIANEAGLDSQYIGHLKIFDDYSLIDLPADMPNEIFKHLKNVWVSGQKLRISRLHDGKPKGDHKPHKDKGPGKTSKKKVHRKGPTKPKS